MPISYNDFTREMERAQAMIVSTPEDAGYWRAYQNGLRRLYHGEAFGTAALHDMRMRMVNSLSEEGRRKGRGYRAGFGYDSRRSGIGRGRKQVGDVRLTALMVPQSVADNLDKLSRLSKESGPTLRRRFLEDSVISELKKWEKR